MQHLDEGTIHSWLDGALSAEDAARAEAHVKECAECAAAVAEARGFIAASSRILTALDNAPRGVIPAVAPKKRVDPIVWRIAAALLLVAGGTLVVVRGNDNERSTGSTVQDRVLMSAPASASPSASVAANDSSVPRGKASGPAVSQSTADAGIAIEAAAPTTELSKKRATDSRSDVQALKDKPVAAGGNAGVGTSMLRENVTASQIAGALPASAPSAATSNVPAPSAPLFGPSRVSGVVIADADAAEQAPPRVVGTPRVFGEKRTLYEVAPGDTVLLAEVLQTRLEAVAVTGMGESRQTSERSTPRPASKAATAAVAPDTQPRPVQPMSASAVSPKGRTLSAEISNGVTTITWIDPATGTTMKLSGKHSREELEGIRRRIEQARAAAAAAAQKKSP